MKILLRHIENLLPEHDCVVVPGLGGFVQNEVSAHINIDSDLFYPNAKEICFNVKLTFNDGLLAQAYQESYDLSFEKSNMLIRQGVQEIKDKLDESKHLSLGRIGTMLKNEQGQIQFCSDNKNLFYPESFGLTPFSYSKLENRQEKDNQDEFIHIRLRRNSFRNFLIGAAACLFLLLLPKPAGTLSDSNNQEAGMMHDYLVSSEIISQNTVEGQALLKEKDSSVDDVINSGLSINAGLTQAAPAPKPKRSYYIVVSSFQQKGSAEEWIRTHKQEAVFSSMDILERDGRARVYIKNFSVRKDAETYLFNFRANYAKYSSAWLLSAKND